jgi:GntR family transcriptional regulator
VVARPARLIIPALSTAAPEALYEQIINGVKREVSEGRLAPGAELPSFRQLAADLLVSIITVKRAYEELERDGIVYRKQGLGTFVADAAHDRSRDIKKQRAIELLTAALREGTEAGLSPQDVARLLQSVIREGREEGALRHARTRR